jgi:hypothetical protein
MKVLKDHEYCKRTNLNGVDLNRNWDFHFNEMIELPEEENPGKYKFSEIETRFINVTLSLFKPHVYLTIHSGADGLYHPLAFNKEDNPLIRNYNEMKNGLINLQKQFCPQCDVGLPYNFLKYVSSGTSADYAYEKLLVPMSYIFEIFDGERKPSSKFRFKSMAGRTTTRTFLKQIDYVYIV